MTTVGICLARRGQTREIEGASLDEGNTIFWGALAAATLLFALAGVVIALRGDTTSWLGIVVTWIISGVLVGAIAFIGVLLLVVAVIGVIRAGKYVIENAIPDLVKAAKKQETTPLIVPAILAALSAVLVGTAQDLLSDRAVLRWTIVGVVAALTLIGAILAYIGAGWANTVSAIVALTLPAAVLIIGCFTTPWWSAFLDLSGGDQALLAFGVAAWGGALICAGVIGFVQYRKRHEG